MSEDENIDMTKNIQGNKKVPLLAQLKLKIFGAWFRLADAKSCSHPASGVQSEVGKLGFGIGPY